MNHIVAKRILAPAITLFEIEARRIARHWQAGQFVIIRPLASSERIPLTIVDGSGEKNTITLVVQAIGKTTRDMAALQVGDAFADVVGPLGEPATMLKNRTAMCIGGGVGVAELLPVARAFREAGNCVVAICGARSKQHMILYHEVWQSVDDVVWATDDGSWGFHGTVVDAMRRWRQIRSLGIGDIVHVIGPIPMMKAAAELTRQWGVKTYASLNPIMLDGTGMCGGCRVTVGGIPRFACVEGPEFDAHQVDFDELARRNRSYATEEHAACERQAHLCKLDKIAS